MQTLSAPVLLLILAQLPKYIQGKLAGMFLPQGNNLAYNLGKGEETHKKEWEEAPIKAG